MPRFAILAVRFSLCLLWGSLSQAANGDEPTSSLDFNRDIRPILSNHCFRCHGPDEEERGGGGAHGLRLDTADGLREDLGGHFAVLPGQPDQSELIARVSSADDSLVMPPPETGVRLTAAEIARLRQWIAEGAVYSQHWSYVVPQRPDVPVLTDASARAWAKNPIDHFVWQRLQQERLVPQPEADRFALVRRVALDVTGLPPSWDEVHQFVSDEAPEAYERMVDRFLGKEAYGEHWARLWLDMARYADSAGYADDPPRAIWAYRDYVIRAFNQNMPFDQFTIEQLAGDLLPNPTPEHWIATAFHRNTLTNNEGGTNDEEFRNVAVVDRVNTTYAVWMGTTMACAQCHTHKYDPLTHAEYFQSFAIFNQTEDADRGDESPVQEVWTVQQEQLRQQRQAQLAEDEAVLAKMTPELHASLRDWEASLPQQPAWRTPVAVMAKSEGGVGLTIDADSNVIRSAQGVAQDNFELELDLAPLLVDGDADLTAIQLEALADDSLPGHGPGWSGGNFVLSEVRGVIVPPHDLKTVGKFVRVELPGAARILSLAEVEVFSLGQNIALGGRATQSSTAFEGAAQRAIDGNTDGQYFNSNSVTHSAANETDPWWEVALADESVIERIVVWNRTDGGQTIQERLRGAVVKVLDQQRRIVWEGRIEDTAKPAVTLGLDGSRTLVFGAAFADFNQDGFHAASLLAQPVDRKTGWAIGGSAGRDHQLTLVLRDPIALRSGSRLKLTLVQQSPHTQHTLGKFRIQATTDESIRRWASIPSPIRQLVQINPQERTATQAEQLASYYRSVAPELEPVRQRIAQTRAELAALQPTTTVPIMRELPRERHRVTKIHNRGNYMDLGDEVSPGVPAVFPAAEEPVTDRLRLARWLVARDNPLTARVTVNRHWEQLFGTGIVATSEEFGAQGDLPSHPELLDWLAVEFMDQGWDMKRLLKTMLLSATYRQSSKVSRELADLDPENRLLARGPRFRLSAETIRDQALAVAGLLSSKLYGPPVKPPQPSLGLAAAFGSSTDWQTSSGEDRYRRGIYTLLRRSNPYPSMSTFDAPNREVCTLRRIRTNTPLQALVTMNDPVYIEAAQAFARQIFARSGSTEERMAWGLRQALVRPVTTEEVRVLSELHEKALAALRNQPEEAHKLATDPIGPAPEGSDVMELAAWTVVANAILNLDEFLMRR